VVTRINNHVTLIIIDLCTAWTLCWMIINHISERLQLLPFDWRQIFRQITLQLFFFLQLLFLRHEYSPVRRSLHITHLHIKAEAALHFWRTVCRFRRQNDLEISLLVHQLIKLVALEHV
jgi:hypothetical protein